MLIDRFLGRLWGDNINRVINTLAVEERPAFLKGMMIGVAIREIVDTLGSRI